MKRSIRFLLTILCVATSLMATAEARLTIEDIGLKTVFPDRYVIVTPEQVASNADLFPGQSAEEVERAMILSGVYALAVSPARDVEFRVIAQEGDEDVALYHDIERYTTQMRSAIRNQFLDKTTWPEDTRYTEAEWTNKTGQGRILNLSYNIREGEEIITRGKTAYTIRNGMVFMLDMKVHGRRLAADDEKAFAAFIAGTAFPTDEEMPLLPVGLTLDSPVPEEVHKDTLTLRGTTTKGAKVTAYFQPSTGAPVEAATATAANNGAFRLDIVLPEIGETRVYLLASLNGFADSELGAWVSYDPTRLPVSFTEYPEGLVTDTQIVISGKTIAGVDIQCMEGEVNRRKRTGNDGKFSFTMDKNATGKRTIVLFMAKDGFENRRFTLTFDRQWLMEDYIKQLDQTVQSLSFANLSERGANYVGRTVKYSGEVLNVSSSEGVTYVELGMAQDKSGNWAERIVATTEELSIVLAEGDMADLYVEVTGETFSFSNTALSSDGIEFQGNGVIEVPSVKLIAYRKK